MISISTLSKYGCLRQANAAMHTVTTNSPYRSLSLGVDVHRIFSGTCTQHINSNDSIS